MVDIIGIFDFVLSNKQRECMSLGATDELWTTIDRLAEGSTGLEIFSALILAAFDALSVVVKRRDMALSTLPDPIAEVSLYQSILVNRVCSPNGFINEDSCSSCNEA